MSKIKYTREQLLAMRPTQNVVPPSLPPQINALLYNTIFHTLATAPRNSSTETKEHKEDNNQRRDRTSP